MNAIRIRTAAALAGFALMSSLVASNALAATRCDAPNSRVDRIACEKAKEGPDALRRFVQRTQSVYGLYFWDYMSGADLDRYYAQQPLRPPEQAASDEGPRAQAAPRR